MSIRDNFTGFWNLWKYGKVKRNYALLDEIHPNRIGVLSNGSGEKISWEESSERAALGQGPTREPLDSVILKVGEDMRTGKL